MSAHSPSNLRSQHFGLASFLFTGLTGLATFLILDILVIILVNITYHGGQHLSWRFLSGGVELWRIWNSLSNG